MSARDDGEMTALEWRRLKGAVVLGMLLSIPAMALVRLLLGAGCCCP